MSTHPSLLHLSLAVLIGAGATAAPLPATADAFGDGLAGAVGGAVVGGLVGGRRGAATGAFVGGTVGVISGAEREYRRERDLRDLEREIIIDEVEDDYYRNGDDLGYYD
jgi:outer membrane lipoprotein SlyB